VPVVHDPDVGADVAFMAEEIDQSRYINTSNEPMEPGFCGNELIWRFSTKSMPSGFRTGTAAKLVAHASRLAALRFRTAAA
jgi:hypothetical protein